MANDIRAIVLDCLIEINENDKPCHLVTNDILRQFQYTDKQERAFFTRLCGGTIERMIELDYIINQFSKVKVKKMKPLIRNLLRMSVYQIKYMDNIPDSAVCNEAVKIAGKRGFVNLKGFVNGVLRNIARNIENIQWPDNKDTVKYLSVVYSMPEWIVEMLLDDYDRETVEDMFRNFLEVKKTKIVCNTNKNTKDELKKLLETEGVTVHDGSYADEALIISDYDYLAKLQSFREGRFFVQDESSMLAVKIADIKEGDLVIDVCAAPGGKSMFAALYNKTGKIISRDISYNKTDLIEENINRCGFDNIEVEVHDALDLDDEYIGKADVVIADLPCSGLGIIGQKPDIKYKITKEQLEELASLQRKMLNVVKKYVKEGGTLLYSTCTINKTENQQNAEWLAEDEDFELISIEEYVPELLKNGDCIKGYIQLIPKNNKTNGFFVSKFRKI